eukprot:SAG11_NODE_15348_length_581_cov_1.035270_1_plen_152_part_01
MLWKAIGAAVDSAFPPPADAEEGEEGAAEGEEGEEADEGAVRATLEMVAAAGERNEMPGVRQYIDAVMIVLLCRWPRLVESWLQPRIADFGAKPQQAQSMVCAAAARWRAHTCTAPFEESPPWYRAAATVLDWLNVGGSGVEGGVKFAVRFS